VLLVVVDILFPPECNLISLFFGSADLFFQDFDPREKELSRIIFLSVNVQEKEPVCVANVLSFFVCPSYFVCTAIMRSFHCRHFYLFRIITTEKKCFE